MINARQIASPLSEDVGGEAYITVSEFLPHSLILHISVRGRENWAHGTCPMFTQKPGLQSRGLTPSFLSSIDIRYSNSVYPSLSQFTFFVSLRFFWLITVRIFIFFNPCLVRPLVSDVRCDVSPPRPHLSALVMTGREARLGTDTELDERKFRNNLSQLIGDFRRIFPEYHQLCRAV